MSKPIIKIEVDGEKIYISADSTVLQACEKRGVEVPRFCFHERLMVAGNCRICLVEIEKSIKPVASCAMPVGEGIKVYTNSPQVQKAREGVLEFILINHPLDCPICDQGGECDLQDQAMAFGGDRTRYFFENKRGVEDKNFGPLIKGLIKRCIHCTRCIRFGTEVAGVESLGTTLRGENTEIGTYLGKIFKSELSANVIDLCPVGALTGKPYAFNGRSWDYKSVESIDLLDSLGSNIKIDVENNKILRVLPRINEGLNEEWITDKIRFSYDALNYQRLCKPIITSEGETKKINWPHILKTLGKYLGRGRKTKILELKGLAGKFSSLESLFCLKKLIYSLGFSNFGTTYSEKNFQQDFLGSLSFQEGLITIDDADLAILVGSHPRKEVPLINSRLRKRFLKGNFEVCNLGGSLGSPKELTYSSQSIGLSTLRLRKILEGKDFISLKLLQSSKPTIICGSELLKREDGKDIIKILEKIETLYMNMKGNKKRILNFIQPTASEIGAAILGYTKASIKTTNNTIIIGINLEDEDLKNLKKKDNIIVNISHHGSKKLDMADIVIPTTSIYEDSGIFLNTESRPQRAWKAVNPRTVLISSKDILLEIAFFLNKAFISNCFIGKKESYFGYHKEVVKHIPGLRYNIGRILSCPSKELTNISSPLISFLSPLPSDCNFIKKKPLVSYLGSYYITDNFTNNSKIISLVSETNEPFSHVFKE